MSFDYAQSLLLQRGRDAGGIALELVELVEELSSELDADNSAQEQEVTRIEREVDNLKADLRSAEEESEQYEKEARDLLRESHSLADALHSALRHNDLATVKACRETLEKWRNFRNQNRQTL